MPKNKRQTTEQSISIRKKSRSVSTSFHVSGKQLDPAMDRNLDLKSCTIDVFEQRTTDEAVLVQALSKLSHIVESNEYNLISFLLPFSLMKHLWAILQQRLGIRSVVLATKTVGFIAKHNPSAVVAEPLVPWMMESFQLGYDGIVPKSALVVLQHVAKGDAEQSMRILQHPSFVRELVSFIDKDLSVSPHDTEAFQFINEVIISAKSRFPLELLDKLLVPVTSFLELKLPSMNTVEGMEILAHMAEHRNGVEMLLNKRVHVLLVSLANHYKGKPWYNESNQKTTFQLLASLVQCLGLIVSCEAPEVIDQVIQQPQFMNAIVEMMEATSGRKNGFKARTKRQLRLQLIDLLANIAGGTPQQIRFVFHDNFEKLYEHIFESMDSLYDPLDIELNRLISNVVENGDRETNIRFLEWKRHKALDVLSYFLQNKKTWNVENVSTNLESMISVMKLKTSYCDKLGYYGAKSALERLATRANNKQISVLSATVLETFDRHAKDNLENQQHPNNSRF